VNILYQIIGKKKSKETILLFLLIVFLIPLLSIAPLLASHRFILLSTLPILFFAYTLFNRNDFSIGLIPLDVSWLIFLFTCFLSYFWAVNGSLIWYPAFCYLSLFLWILIFRTLKFDDFFSTYLPNIFLGLFFISMLYVLGTMLNGNLEGVYDWNYKFGYNMNITSSFFVSLFPFLLFNKDKRLFIKILNLIGFIFILFILYYSSARGAIIAFLYIILYYMYSSFSKKIIRFFLGFLAISMLSLFSIFYYMPEVTYSIPILREFNFSKFGFSGHIMRYYMIKNSLLLFCEYPFTGIGLGNWHVEAYKYDLSDVYPFNIPYRFNRWGNHNLYSQHLSELGLIGFFTFYFPIGVILWRGWVKCRELTDLQKAGYASILVYLVSSFFYRDANAYESHFSGIQLLAFCALGLLTRKSTYLYKLNKLTKGLFFILSLACLGWFSFYMKTSNVYLETTRLPTEDLEITTLIESLYHPIFKTTHEFYQDHTGSNKSLSLELALLYQKQIQYDKAEKYFQMGLNLAPYDNFILINYAKFLLEIRREPDTAKEYALRAYAIQNNNYDTNFILTEISIAKKEYINARDYLKAIRYNIGYDQKINLLFAEIAIGEKKYNQARRFLITVKKAIYQNQVKKLTEQIKQEMSE